MTSADIVLPVPESPANSAATPTPRPPPGRIRQSPEHLLPVPGPQRDLLQRGEHGGWQHEVGPADGRLDPAGEALERGPVLRAGAEAQVMGTDPVVGLEQWPAPARTPRRGRRPRAGAGTAWSTRVRRARRRCRRGRTARPPVVPAGCSTAPARSSGGAVVHTGSQDMSPTSSSGRGSATSSCSRSGRSFTAETGPATMPAPASRASRAARRASLTGSGCRTRRSRSMTSGRCPVSRSASTASTRPEPVAGSRRYARVTPCPSAVASGDGSPHGMSGTVAVIGVSAGSMASSPSRNDTTRSGTRTARPGKGRSRSSISTRPPETRGPWSRWAWPVADGQRYAGQLERHRGRRPPPADVVVEIAEELPRSAGRRLLRCRPAAGRRRPGRVRRSRRGHAAAGRRPTPRRRRRPARTTRAGRLVCDQSAAGRGVGQQPVDASSLR